MKKKNVLPGSAAVRVALLLATCGTASGIELYSENFDSQALAKIGTNNGTGMTVRYVDYSAMTVGAALHNIPEAPRQIAGSLATRGVHIQVNYGANPVATERIANLIALDDAGGTRLLFTNNYQVKFDFYLRLSPNVMLAASGLPTNTGTTEQVLWGVGYQATLPMGRGFRTSRGSGMWGWVATEGGHGATVGADASLFNAATLIGGRNMDLISAVADTASYFTPAFGADASPVPHCPANQWVEATITARAGQVTVEYMAVGRTLTKFFENAPGPVAGSVMVGYEDSFVSNSFDPDQQWLLLDNLVVEDLTPPTMVVSAGTPFITYTGTPVTGTWLVNNTRAAGDLTISAVNLTGAAAADFSVQTPLPLVVGPGATLPLTLAFNPAAPDGIKTATATIVSDDPQLPNYVLGELRVRRSVGSFLEAHYKLNETSGTSLTDASGFGVTGTMQVRDPVAYGRPSLLGAADTGTSLGFLPAQTSVTGNYFTSPVVHTPTFSISLWMKPAAAGAVRSLFQRDFDFATPYEKICGLQLTAAGTVKYRVRNTDIFESDSAAPLNDGSNWHVVLTHLDEDGFGNATASRSRLYVNGLLVAEKTGAATAGFDDYPLNPVVSGLHFASRTVAGSGYSGDLDDVQIYGVELSREQVWALYKLPGSTARPGFDFVSTSLTPAPAVQTLTVPSSPQGTYKLFRSGDMQTWQQVGAAVPGTADGLTTSLTDPDPSAARWFYRVDRE